MVAYQVNAFTHQNQGGNPAGVVLNAGHLSNEQMQNIANKLSFSETAFVTPISNEENADVNFHIRFFTPNTEVDFCGHATLAAFSLMFEKSILTSGRYKQQTKAGILTVDIAPNGDITQQQAKPAFLDYLPVDEIAESLNIAPEHLSFTNFPIQAVTTGLVDIIIPVQKNKVDSIQPNFAMISDVCQRFNAIGYHIFELEESTKTIRANCRNFAPLVDIPEESATGSASGALAAYLNKYHIQRPKTFEFMQGNAMEMPSMLYVDITSQNDETADVLVSGSGQLIKEINL